MARIYEQAGAVLTYSNSGSAISAGDVVVIGDLIGIALVDIANGESGSVGIEGVFTVTKASGTAWNQGDVISWDASASAFQKGPTAATGDVIGCGVAFAAAASGATSASLKLTPGTGAYEA